MSNKESLIAENKLLQRKLALAEAWMRREVAHHKQSLAVWEAKKSGRKKLDNILERESVDIITRRIESYFWDSLRNAPKHTLEHLIDAEIYWQTLQKFPTLDALPVVSSYQKILDAFFERILEGFRSHHHESMKNLGFSAKKQPSFDKDIENVLRKKYSLSLGRWFQFFSKLREGSEFGGMYEDALLVYLSEHHEALLETCVTDPFFSGFSELIALEVFGRKRHDTKISYADARRVREICVGGYTISSIFQDLFS
jgi:hypothetical protein